MNFLKSTVALSALLLSACASVGPDYQQPDAAQVNLAVNDNLSIGQYERQWWQRFDDPVLNQLVELALEHNQSLAAAQANIERALAQFSDIDNDVWPSASADLSYQNSKGQQPGGSTQRVQGRTYQGGVNVNWQLDLAGKLRRASESASANAQAVQSDLHNLQVAIVSNLVSVYADFRGTQHQLKVAKRNVELLEELAKLVQIRQKEGLASELELTRIKAQQSGVKASIEQLNSTLKRKAYDLALLSGYRANELPVTLGEQEVPALNGPVAIGDAASLLLRRPDIQAAERRLAAVTADIGVATAAFYPQLKVNGFLGFVTGQSSLITDNSSAWSVIPSISWQGLDWNSIKAQVAMANAQQRKVLADYRQQMLTAVNQAQSSLTAYSHSQNSLHHLSAHRQASEKAMELATAQYRVGLTDLLSLLDTERSLLAAQDAYAQGQTQVMKDLVAIYHAFGGAIGEVNKG